MAKFERLLVGLSEGYSARRDGWEPIIRMFVEGDTLMCQCGAGKPWRCALSWDEIIATDWQLVLQASTYDITPQVAVPSLPTVRVPAHASLNFLSKARERYSSSLLSFGPK